jgi:FixJ family two-component response regulator
LVFLVDDEPEVRRSLTRLLASAGIRSESFDSGNAFLQRPFYDGPACLVLDLRLPGMSGLEIQDHLRDRGNQLPIIFISGHGDVTTSVRALKRGAVDFLTKPFDDDELLGAIEAAVAADQAARVRRAEMAALVERYESLTPRERQVADLVAKGFLNKQIAGQLGTSEKTIKVQRAQVMAKMEAESLADLVRMGARLHSTDGPRLA